MQAGAHYGLQNRTWPRALLRSHGDASLKEFALRLTGALRSGDTVARIGGDEFVVLVEGSHSYRHLELLTQKIVALVQRHSSSTENRS